MAADPTRTTYKILVQTASSLPSSDSAWTTMPWLSWEGGSEDAGAILGDAVLTQRFGNRTAQGATRFSYVPDQEQRASLIGKIVRLLLQDDAGDISVNGDTWTAFWWGVITALDSQPDGAEFFTGGTTVWRASSIAVALDLIEISHGYVIGPETGSAISVGRCPVFNILPSGDRSASTYEVNGNDVYVHDLTTTIGTGNYWLAVDIVNLLLGAFSASAIGPDYVTAGWTWELDDPDNCLQYVVPQLDIEGMTILQVINNLIGESRGLTYWCTVDSDGRVTLHVQSVSPTSVQCPTPPIGPAYLYPAASRTATFDIRQQGFLDACSFTIDTTNLYDQIEVIGAKPWVGITVSFSVANPGSLVGVGVGYGWTAGQESEWGPPTGNPQASGTDDVWRRFMIDPSWNGVQYSSSTSGLRNKLTKAIESSLSNTDIFGANGYTGEREYDPSDPGLAPALLITGERYLPCGQGFSDDRMGPRQPPVVIVQTAPGPTYLDHSQDYGVEVQQQPLSVRIDDGAYGQYLKGFGTNYIILASIGVREVEPLRVSWVAQPYERFNASPRIKTIRMPQCEQWIVLKGTVTGSSFVTLSLLQTLPDDLVVRDDTVWLQCALAIATPWLTQPSTNFQVIDRGTLDISDTYRSGTLLTTVTRGDGDVTINGILRRRWGCVRKTLQSGAQMLYYSTEYETRRTPPDSGVIARARID